MKNAGIHILMNSVISITKSRSGFIRSLSKTDTVYIAEIPFRISRLFTILILFLSTSSFAASYYVSSTGNDANSGTSIAGAWATINKVNLTVFHPGDALYFEGGQTFQGSIYLNDSDANDPGNIFIISSYGTGRATINAGTSYGFYAYNTQGFSISNLIFDGNSTTTNTAIGFRLYADVSGDKKFSNISIANIEIKNFGAQGVAIGGWNGLTGYQNLVLSNLSVHNVVADGIVIYGYTSQTLVGWPNKNVSVSNCEIYNVPGFANPSGHQGSGIVVSGVDSGVIQYCVAHDNGQSNIHCGGPGGIWCWDSNNFTIQFCESYKNHSGSGCDGIGFDLDGGMINSVMQYNYSHNNDGAGYLLGQFENARPWGNNTVRYNISENDGVVNEGSIGLFKGPGTTMNGASIYNNTIYVSPQAGNNSECALYFKDWSTGINNIAFYNNIFITTGNVPFINIPAGYSAFFAGNIYWASGGNFSIGYQGKNYSSLPAWRTATGNEVVNGSNTGFTADPLLSNTGVGGTVGFGNKLASLNAYKIRDPASPALNAALDLSSLYSIDPGTRDFWGIALAGGKSNDIGANQYTSVLAGELLGFYGNCSGSGQDIFWNTAEELNLKGFELMYSANGVDFNKLADISPKGNNSGYNYVNDSISPGNNYYQLKMIHLDGAITYSPVVNIKYEPETAKITAWPNPFSRSVTISIESTTQAPAILSLYDAVGKMLSLRKIQLQEGNNRVIFDGMDNLPAGAYYLQIIHQDKTEHLKLLKVVK
jgi:hypothetical protein